MEMGRRKKEVAGSGGQESEWGQGKGAKESG